MPPPVAVRTVREQIVDRLRTEVLSEHLRSEEPLREVELAERFGVGRGPIRDALLQLTHEGALVYQTNRGVRVGAPATDELRELLVDTRRRIEAHALEACFESFDEDDHDWMQENLAALASACEKADVPAIVEEDMAFHRWLVRRGGGPDLEAVWLPICVRIRLNYARHDDYREVHAEHERIVSAIRRGRRKTAVNALAKHVR